MTKDEIIAVLEQKGFTKIEFSDESILADLGLGNGEYWITIVPPSDDGDWLRVRLTEAGDGECLSDRFHQNLESAIAEMLLIATIDFAEFHNSLADVLPY